MPIPLAAEIIIGGIVGTLFAELYKRTVLLGELIFNKCPRFESLVKCLEETLTCLKPLVEQIEGFNNTMNLTSYAGLEDLEKEMKRGLELVVKCFPPSTGMQVPWRNPLYITEVEKLIASLKSQHKRLQDIRDHKEILFHSRNNNEHMGEIRRMMMSNRTSPWTTLYDGEWTSFALHTDHSSVPIGEELQDVHFIDQNGGALKIEASLSLPIGLDDPLNELKTKLLTDDEVPMLLLTGLGGCGKTTLARHFCGDKEVKGRFKDNIFFVTVPKDPKLDCNFLQLLHMGSPRPTTYIEVKRLLENAGHAPLLLVLDDVWSASELLLQQLNELKEPNWKILVTSRVQFQGFFTCVFNMDPLNNEDAITLFLHSASKGNRIGSYVSKDLVTQTVGLLKGLPLAIEVVGTSFGQIPATIWDKRFKEWSTGSLILEFENELLSCLQRSLVDLDRSGESCIEECFIQLGSFPKGQRTPVAALIDMWAELYDQFNQTEATRDQHEGELSIAKLQLLSNRSLANLVLTRSGTLDIMDGYYSEHFVVQHEMLRELAVYQTHQQPLEQRKSLIIDVSGNNFPEWWTKQEHDQPITARLLSISTDSVFLATWPYMDVPKTEVLVLNFQSSRYGLPEFVEEMEILKVLIVTYNGFTQVAEPRNFELLGSLAKLKRIRLERISFPFIVKNSIVLRSLQKISLFLCKVGPAFSNNSLPCPFPNLMELNIDYCKDLVEVPMVVDLIHLRKLSITSCHNLSALPDTIGENLVNLQVLRLRSCTDLKELPDSVSNLSQLIVLDISNCFSLKKLPENIGKLCSLQKLNMRRCSRLQDLPFSVTDLKQLLEVICDDDMYIFWEMYLHDLRDTSIRVVGDEISIISLATPLSGNDVFAVRNIVRVQNPNQAAEKEKLEKLEQCLEHVPVHLASRLAEAIDKSYFNNTAEILQELRSVKNELNHLNAKYDGINNLLTELLGTKRQF